MLPCSSWSSFLALAWCCTLAPTYGSILTKSCLRLDDYNFRPFAFAGTWYEQRRLYDPSEPEQEDCVVINYQIARDDPSDRVVQFDIQRTCQYSAEGQPIYTSGAAEPYDEPTMPRFLERWYGSESNATSATRVEIMALSYLRYAVVYYCTPFNGTHFTETARVLSRELHLDRQDDDVIDFYVQNLFNRTEHRWRTTQLSPEFCKLVHVDDNDASKAPALRVRYAVPTIATLLAVLPMLARLLP